MTDALHVKLRPLEREDLRFVHQLDNNASVMRYWFEEPYEAFVELSDLYDKHISFTGPRRGSNSNSLEKLAISGVKASGALLRSHAVSSSAAGISQYNLFTDDSFCVHPIILANTIVYTSSAMLKSG